MESSGDCQTYIQIGKKENLGVSHFLKNKFILLFGQIDKMIPRGGVLTFLYPHRLTRRIWKRFGDEGEDQTSQLNNHRR